jgi:cell division protein FtsA
MAEDAKVRHGSAVVRDEDRDRQAELLGMDGSQARAVPVTAIQRLLHDRAVELVRMTLVKLHDAGFTRVPPGGIVFTGGSSKLDGLLEVARDYGAPTVRLGQPSSALGIPAELHDSSFATGVGLLLWGIRHRHTGAVAPDLTLATPVRDRLRGIFSRIALHRTAPSGA